MRWSEVTAASVMPDPQIERTSEGWTAHIAGRRVTRPSLVEIFEMLEGQRRTAHVYADESVVGHCVFCGSGDVVGRSDGTVECQLCHRSFMVMEQPLYSAQPAPDYQSMQIDGTGLDDGTGDPIDEAPAFAPPQAPEEPPAGGEVNPPPSPGGDEKKDGPPPPKTSLYRTAKGYPLDRDTFIRHVAIQFARSANEG